jgi:hypothetical protein
MRVYSSVRDKADVVYILILFLSVGKCVVQYRVGVQFFIFDRFINPNEILIDHATGSDVHVTHFGVAHLAVRQTYSKP